MRTTTRAMIATAASRLIHHAKGAQIVIIAAITKRSWFPVEYGERTDTLCFYLCDGLTILIDCVWKESGDKFILSDFK